MVVNQRVTGRALTMPVGISIGLVTALAITGAGCAMVASLINGEQIGMDMLGYGAMIILFCASFLGAALASLLIKGRKIPVSVILGVVYFVSLLLVNGIFFGGEINGVGATALVVLAGSICAGLLPNPGASGRARRHKKWRNG